MDSDLFTASGIRGVVCLSCGGRGFDGCPPGWPPSGHSTYTQQELVKMMWIDGVKTSLTRAKIPACRGADWVDAEVKCAGEADTTIQSEEFWYKNQDITDWATKVWNTKQREYEARREIPNVLIEIARLQWDEYHADVAAWNASQAGQGSRGSRGGRGHGRRFPGRSIISTHDRRPQPPTVSRPQ